MIRTFVLSAAFLALLVSTTGADDWPATVVVSNVYECLNEQRELDEVPVTFSRIGAEGDFVEGITPVVSGEKMPAQVDVLRRADDGSIRHALVSLVLPRLAASERIEIDWLNEKPAQPQPFVWAVDSASLDLKLVLKPEEGATLTSDVGEILRTGRPGSGRVSVLYDGPVMKEYEIHDVPVDADGEPSPHLDVFWRLRFFTGQESVRVAVVVERCKERKKGLAHPVQYQFRSVAVHHGEEVLYREGPYDHLDQTRYRIVCWTRGPLEEIHRRPNFDYWAKGRFVPKYRWTEPMTPAEVDEVYTARTSGRNEQRRRQGILERGIIYENMPGTGGRWDIGPYPAWTVAYLLSGAPQTYRAILHTDGNGSGAYFIHVRQHGAPGYNVFTVEQPPLDRGFRLPLWTLPDGTRTPVKPDHAHAPSLGYVGYLLTGDKFYAEEASFWASYQLGEWPHQGMDLNAPARAQAWGLRHAVDAAFILPKTHPLQAYFEQCVNKYLDEFTDQHVRAGKRVHFLRAQFRTSGRTDWVNCTRCSAWQYAWLVWSLGNAADKGFDNAKPVRDWAAEYIIGFYTSKDEFVVPDGKTYRYDPRDAMPYSTAVSLLETQVVAGADGRDSIKVVRKIKDLENYGEIWYYTKMNEDNAFVYDKGPSTRPDGQGNWPLRPDGWGHGQAFSAVDGKSYRWWAWHRYGAWVGLVAALEGGVPNAEEAWNVMTSLAGPAEYGFEMLPRRGGSR